MEKLYYINDEAEIIYNAYGFTFVPSIAEKYRGGTARGRVVLAIRDTRCLRNVFDLTCMDYILINQILYALSSTTLPCEVVSEILTVLYRDDPIFHKYLAMMYYAKFITKTQENKDTILDIIMKEISLIVSISMNEMNSHLSGLSYMYTNGIEYYYSFADKGESKVIIPAGYKYEVLTNAKVWDGSIQRQ